MVAKVSLCPEGGKQASKRQSMSSSRKGSLLRFRETQFVLQSIYGMIAQPLSVFDTQRLSRKRRPLHLSATKVAIATPSYVQSVIESSNFAHRA